MKRVQTDKTMVLKVSLSVRPPASCPRPEPPTYGRRLGRVFGIGHEVHFLCRPGYELIGPRTRACLESLKWSGQQPMCRRKPADPFTASQVLCRFRISRFVTFRLVSPQASTAPAAPRPPSLPLLRPLPPPHLLPPPSVHLTAPTSWAPPAAPATWASPYPAGTTTSAQVVNISQQS